MWDAALVLVRAPSVALPQDLFLSLSEFVMGRFRDLFDPVAMMEIAQTVLASPKATPEVLQEYLDGYKGTALGMVVPDAPPTEQDLDAIEDLEDDEAKWEAFGALLLQELLRHTRWSTMRSAWTTTAMRYAADSQGVRAPVPSSGYIDEDGVLH